MLEACEPGNRHHYAINKDEEDPHMELSFKSKILHVFVIKGKQLVKLVN